MISESDAIRIAGDASKRLGAPTPRVSFQLLRVAFLPVAYFGGTVTITPASLAALSPEALDFAVVHGVAHGLAARRGQGVRQLGIVLTGLVAGVAVSRAGAPKGLAIVAVFLGAAVALAATAYVRAQWLSPRIDRTILQALPNLDGARAYAQATDLQNLNGARPEPWANAHDALSDLASLERAASKR